MDEPNAAQSAAKALMRAYKELHPDGEQNRDSSQGFTWKPSPSGSAYFYYTSAEEAFELAAKVLSRVLDDYPYTALCERLAQLTMEVRDHSPPIQEVCRHLETRIKSLVAELSQMGEWELVTAVKGMDLRGEPIKLGRCELSTFSEEDHLRWGQRYATGLHNPPASTQPVFSLVRGVVPGQTVAITTVHAADIEHAKVASLNAIEEALNLWRYGQVVLCGFRCGVPEVGTAAAGGWEHSLYIRKDIGRDYASTSSSGAPSHGLPLVAVKSAAGWAALASILTKSKHQRTDLERRLMTALLWCGDASRSSADAIRLVSLVTALESILLLPSDAKGKKRKLASRVSILTNHSARTMEQIYNLRSECVHSGEDVIPDRILDDARRVLGDCVAALLDRTRFPAETTVEEVVAKIDPPASSTPCEAD